MTPAIDAYLAAYSSQFGGDLAETDPQLRPRVFCHARILQITGSGSRWPVGLELNCGEFARRERTLLEGTSGYPAQAGVMTLTGSRDDYRGLSLLVSPEDNDPAWVGRNFSAKGTAWIDSANSPTAPDPNSQAWRPFGFPSGTWAVQE